MSDAANHRHTGVRLEPDALTPLVSIIVPVWRDREALVRLIESPALELAEVVVAVPYGDAPLHAEAVAARPHVRLMEAPRGRAAQMNAGAADARGRWLVFLHVDTRLPPEWREVVENAERDPDVVGGAFRFALESRDVRARLLEWAVRLRVRILHLPYGDQAVFVRTAVFRDLGGYADLPLMEDIDFIRRLRKRGHLRFSTARAVTSARRWERDGWVRRSTSNLGLAIRFLCGVPPSRLAQRYFGRRSCALVVMGRAPWRPGKTRLLVPGEAAHADLRHALFFDTLEAASALQGVDHLLAVEPSADVARARETIAAGRDVIAQRGETIGDRMAHVFEDVFRLGYDSVLVVGSDLPDLPLPAVSAAHAELSRRRDAVVIGPATDGGYYLIGLTRRHPELFSGIDWSSPRVLAQTQEAAALLKLPVVLLESWSDVDGIDDLMRLAHTSATTAAARTRAWMVEHPATWQRPE